MVFQTTSKRQYLTVKKEGGIAEVYLHINKSNSYNWDFYREFNAVIHEIRVDKEIKVVLLMSDVPRFFSAGASVEFLLNSEPEYKTQFCLYCNETLDQIARSPQIYIAVLEGHTVGGGLEMALAMDLRFAGDGDYKIGLPEVTLGVLAGTGGTQRLARLIGPSKALDLCITGRTLTPKEAYEYGIVDRLFPQEEVREKAREYARQLVESATYAISNIKLAIMNGKEMPLNVAIRYEGELQNLLFRSHDAREGLTAFLEKRKPQFKGH